MPADPSIILAGKMPEIANPIDSASKALTMSNLMQEHQSNAIKLNDQQRQYSDQQSVRDAYKQNTSQGPDGTPVVDRQGLMNDLMKANPQMAQKVGMDFRAQDLEKVNQQHAAAKSILFGIDPTSQSSVDQAFEQAKKLGLPPLEGALPKNINDPNFQTALRQAQVRNLTAEEQIAQQNKQQEMASKSQELGLQTAKLNNEISQHANDKRMEANQQTLQAIESGRQSPDAQQALKDMYAAKKVNTLVEQGKDEKGNLDPNKLNMTQVQLVAGEVGKIATGGAPTMDELHGLTPGNVPQVLSRAAEKLSNDPTPANAGEFVKNLQRYSNSVADDAKKLVSDRDMRVIEQRKEDVGPRNYELFKKNAGRLDIQADGSPFKSSAPGKSSVASKPAVMSFDEWKSKQASVK